MSSARPVAAALFRSLHQPGRPLVMPNPWDVGTARVLAGLGFQAVATTSAGLAFSLGERDGRRLVSLDQALDHSRQIVGATGLPVNGDLENGYADRPEGVARTVLLAAEAGLAGCSIEDATGDPQAPIYDFTLAVERIQAAAEAARQLSSDFVLTARAENFLHNRPDLDDTLKRLQAFEAAGADVLYAPGLPDLAAVRLVCGSLRRPVNVLAGRPGQSVAELAAAGAARISVGSWFARAAQAAFFKAARELADHGTFGFTGWDIPFRELDQLVRPGTFRRADGTIVEAAAPPRTDATLRP